MTTGKWLLIILCFAGSRPVMAAQWVENASDVQVNWSSLTARFSGIATSEPDNREGLKGLERTAWRNGYENAGSKLEQVLREQFARASGDQSGAEPASVAGALDEVRKSVKSLNATFFASGAVEVSMEASLHAGFAAALKRAGAATRTLPTGDSSSTGGASGLVIRVPGSAKPGVTFWLVDGSGKVLFDPAMVSTEAVSRGAMARWFKSPGKDEISKMTGESPETIQVTEVRSGNRFVVDEAHFRSLASQSIRALADGKAIVVAR